MCVCEGKEESVNRWNNRGVIAVLSHCCVHCLLSLWPLPWGQQLAAQIRQTYQLCNMDRTHCNTNLVTRPVSAAHSSTQWIFRSTVDIMCQQSVSGASLHVDYLWVTLLSHNPSSK